jgi:small redox-active disulfide protein 2
MKTLHILGTGCASCERLAEMADHAARELGIEYTLTKVSDIDEITSYGVMSTPALVVDGDVKVSGRVPSAAEVKDLIA